MVGGVSGCGDGVGAIFGVGAGFLAIQSSKKPFLGVSGAFGAGLGAETGILLSATGTTSMGLSVGSGGISGFLAFLAFSAALQRSWISFSTSARVLPNLAAE